LQRKARDDHKNDADGGALAVTMMAEAGQENLLDHNDNRRRYHVRIMVT
jgi:hypothetical protein